MKVSETRVKRSSSAIDVVLTLCIKIEPKPLILRIIYRLQSKVEAQVAKCSGLSIWIGELEDNRGIVLEVEGEVRFSILEQKA